MCDNRDFRGAESLLRRIVDQHPEFAPAHALLGRMPGVQNATDDEFSKWESAASPHCQRQADFWIAVGDRRFRASDFPAALSCFITAAQLAPNDPTAWTQIGQTIRQLRSDVSEGGRAAVVSLERDQSSPESKSDGLSEDEPPEVSPEVADRILRGV